VLVFFNTYGMPGNQDGPIFVFNGDFVDRGAHQLETIGLLLALKVAFPKNIWLIRGNHEDRTMNERYGFQEECARQLGEEMGKKTHALLEDVFDYLPMAAVLEERVLVVHGGIGRGDWDLNQLRTIERPLTTEILAQEENRWLLNILWSDPIADDAHNDVSDGMSDHSECPSEVCGVHSSWRNDYSVRFGWNVTKSFCARNGLGLVVRSHQCRRDGTGFSVMHDNMLMRVFSARDYEGMGNDSATLLIDYDAAAMTDGADSAWHTETFDDAHIMSGSFESTALPSEGSPAATMSGTMSSAGGPAAAMVSGEEGQTSSASMELAEMPLSFFMERKHLTVRAQVLASLTKALAS
jgi:diadenosine tetraphosphatase ApaH/serine/threonine PP2A family protein phosphatase